MSPDGREAALGVRHPVQVLEAAAGLEVWVALDVVEEVARRGGGEQSEAAPLLRGKELVAVLPGALGVELERGLVAKRPERPGGQVRNRGAGGRVAERLKRRDPREVKALDLVAADRGDPHEVVVSLPLCVAERQEG